MGLARALQIFYDANMSPPELAPLLFKPIYKDYLWGSDRISTVFHRKNTPTPCAESWEVAERSEGMSCVEGGPFAGLGLDQLVAKLTAARLLGSKEQMPLLVKIIDAAKLLSIQVHPDERRAKELDGEPKTEMWYVLDALPDAYVYVGLKEGVDAAGCMAALQTGDVDAALNRLAVEAGDVIYVPAGTVHAIGPGCLMLEVQQSSNTTYRLYDWDRIDLDGKPRELHIAKGLQAIDPSATWSLSRVRTVKEREGYSVEKLVQSPFFNLDKLMIQEPIIQQSTGSFQLFFAEKGSAEIVVGRERLLLQMGRTALIPAGIETFTLMPHVKTVAKGTKSTQSTPVVELIRICLP